jgi:hypothetical protein
MARVASGPVLLFIGFARLSDKERMPTTTMNTGYSCSGHLRRVLYLIVRDQQTYFFVMLVAAVVEVTKVVVGAKQHRPQW